MCSSRSPAWIILPLTVWIAALVGEGRALAGQAHEVLVRGGTFVLGRAGGRADEGPPHRVTVSPFYVDETLVTRAAFARFVDGTRFKTTAERIGFGMVAVEGMLDWEWQRVPGATFRRPFRDGDRHTDDFLREDAPVVMVSYTDATAYCVHAGKRLPTEAEWELAMSAGAETTRFPWGDAPTLPSGAYGLNFWQGASHAKNTVADGYVYVSPVKAFPPNALGIYDAVGNVWQWTSDWYAPDTYLAQGSAGNVDPIGPAHGDRRVLRGGSWWCADCACSGYGLYYRGKAKPDAPFNNNGFRCARNAR